MQEELYNIKTPRIDLELCTRDVNMPPIDKVYAMDEDSFEKFINEWLNACRLKKYENIQHVGGSGDKGRDIIATLSDGTLDYYQCKHYDNPLSPSEFYTEFGKLCYYTWKKDFPVPRRYYIVASHDLGPTLIDLIRNKENLKNGIMHNWDQYCKTKITRKGEIPLSNELENYINNFDFSIVEHIPIQKIIEEHIDTIYGKIRFGGRSVKVTPVSPTEDVQKEELPYVEALLEVYSEALGTEISSVEDLQHTKYNEHFQRQRIDYYAIETIRRFVRDTLTDSEDFKCLKNEIYAGIIDTHEQEYKNGLYRLTADLTQAVTVNTGKSLLDSHLHLIGVSEKKGTCHLLVNDKKLRWIKND